MPCEVSAQQIALFFDGELSPQDSKSLAVHVAGCRACATELQQLNMLRKGLDAELRTDVPAGLLQRISGALDQADAQDAARDGGTKPPARPWANLAQALINQAAVLVLVAGLSAGAAYQFAMHARQDERVTQDVIAAHLRAMMQDSQVAVISTDQHTVRPWFASRTEFSPPVRDFADKGYALVGGRLDYVDSQRVAAIVYKHDKHLIDMLIWPSGHATTKPELKTRNGLNMIYWRQDGLETWIISDMNAEELRAFAGLVIGT